MKNKKEIKEICPNCEGTGIFNSPRVLQATEGIGVRCHKCSGMGFVHSTRKIFAGRLAITVGVSFVTWQEEDGSLQKVSYEEFLALRNTPIQ